MAQGLSECDIETCPTIPVLDDPINTAEVLEAITSMKSNKSCGPDGVTPGLHRILPINWIMYITSLSGARNVCNNYRGIAISSYMFKLFDIVLHNRLKQWYRPCREQAGCQKGRGCIEQILALRLIIDYCIKRRCKLHLLFIDFSKAYDKNEATARCTASCMRENNATDVNCIVLEYQIHFEECRHFFQHGSTAWCTYKWTAFCNLP